jgi:ABC-type phosphate transport system substrate-binding protein
MTASNKTRWLIVVLGLLGGCSAAHAQDVILVVNKSAQISEISASDLRAIYTGTKTRLSDGSHAVPVTLKGGPANEVFLRNYLAERPDEFRAQWRKAVFTGQGAMPRAFDSESALIEFVAATPGALGYVSHVSPNENVKVLSVAK